MADVKRLQIRRDTLADWVAVNPILLEGEVGLIIENGRISSLKIGDGVSSFAQLPQLTLLEAVFGGYVSRQDLSASLRDYATMQYVNNELSKYVTTDTLTKNYVSNSSLTEILKKYYESGYVDFLLSSKASTGDLNKTNTQLGIVQTDVATLKSYFQDTDDVDDIINKWRELEAFLAGQTETSTLADLLSVKADNDTVIAINSRVTDLEDSDFVDIDSLRSTLEDYYTKEEVDDLLGEAGGVDLTGYVNEIAASGTGNGIASVSKDGSKLTFTMANFLTSHQSLDGYINNVSDEGSGNVITDYRKSGKSLVLQKGLSVYSKAEVDKLIGDISIPSLGGYVTTETLTSSLNNLANTYLSFRGGGTVSGATTFSGGLSVQNSLTLLGVNVAAGSSGLTFDGKIPMYSGDAYTKSEADKEFHPLTTVDTAPTINSSNLVTSGGVYSWVTGQDYLSKYGTAANSAKLGNVNASEYLLSSTAASTYLPLSGGTMTGTIITPGNDSVVIKPAKHNYDQIGGEGIAFWKIFATNFHGTLNGNASTATKLSTARTIWGQSFDGTNDIPVSSIGAMRYLYFRNAADTDYAGYVGRGGSGDTIYLSSYANDLYLMTNNGGIVIDSTGNVGIGTTNPNTKLHVVGSTKIEGTMTVGSSTDYIAYDGSSLTGYKSSSSAWSIDPSGNGSFASLTVGGNAVLTQGALTSINDSLNKKANTADVIPWSATHNYASTINPNVLTSPVSDRWYLVVKAAGNGNRLMVNIPWVNTTYDLSSYLPKAGGKISGSLTFSATSGSHIIGNSTQGISFKTTSNSDTTLYFEQQSANSYSIRSDDEAAYWNLGDDLNRFNVLYCRSVSQSSDATLKNILGNVALTTSQIANAPAVHFTWKNGGAKDVGTIAQYWKDVLPEVVSGEEGSYGMNYAVLGVVSSIILARNIETHEQRIARLEKEISDLQKELNALVNNE